jgi:protocatechuate 3,4-dioxygenase beta subunit
MSSFGLPSSLLLLLIITALTSMMRLTLAQQEEECTLQQPLQQTPSDQLGPFYLSNSPLSPLMAPEDLLNDPARRLEVRGRVLSSSLVAPAADCNNNNTNKVGLAGVSVEMWYAGEPDADGNYYQDDEYRGQVVTDECGYYELVQTFPALYPTRPILHDHFRLSKNGQELLVTQMYFIGTDADQGYFVSSSADNAAREMQAVNILQNSNGTRSVEFDMYVDLIEDDDDDVSNSALCQQQASTNSTTTDDSPPANSSTNTTASIPVLEQQQQPPEEIVDTASSSIQSTSSSTSSASIIAGKLTLSMFFMLWALFLG